MTIGHYISRSEVFIHPGRPQGKNQKGSFAECFPYFLNFLIQMLQEGGKRGICPLGM